MIRRLPRLLGGAALLLSAFVPAAQADLFNPRVFELDNGLQVVVIEDHRAPVVSHMVWYKVGAADEPPGKSGIAHFLEHLMFKGTEKIAPGEFSKQVARIGGQDNAFTAQDYTGYFQNVAADQLETVMALEADRMVNLRLAEEDVRTERLVILEERRSRTDNDPGAQLSEAARAAQYKSHPYGIPIIGWEHEMKLLSREDALDFYEKHYAPNNAILIVAGDVTPAQVRNLAERHYGVIPAREVALRHRPQEPPQLAARRVMMEDPRVRQPSLRRTYLAPSRASANSQHAVPLQVFAEILGGGTTSRLYRDLVVEQKLASSAGAFYRGVSLDATTFYLYATPVPGGDVAAVEAAMDKTLETALTTPITGAELERAKNILLAAAIYARDNLRSGPRIFGAALTSGLTVEQVESWPDQVEAVTIEDVMAAAAYVLDIRRSVTSILLPKPTG